MRNRAPKKGHPSLFNEIWSCFEKGVEQIIFKVAGRGYLILASYDDRPTVKARLFAARQANLGVIVSDDGAEAFAGVSVDQEGNRCVDNESEHWRGAPETLAWKSIIAARLHSIRVDDERWARQMADASISRKNRLKKVASANEGSNLTPDILRAIFDEGKKELIIFDTRARKYLINARYDEHPLIKAELLAACEYPDGIVLRNEIEEIFTGNFVDEEGHEYPDELEPQTLSGTPEVLARKVSTAAGLHGVRTTPVTRPVIRQK